MLIIIFTSLALAFSLSLLLASTPLLLGAWILLLTFSIAGVFSFSISSWLGIFTLLIYVGGLLVIFSYFIALAPNQIFEIKTILLSSLFVFFCFSIFLISVKSLFPIGFQAPVSSFPIYTLLTHSNIALFILLALILFLTLIAVVKIRTFSSGPLRSWKYL